MKHQELVNFLEFSGKDPSRLIFEDELTDIYNRRFLFHYFHHKVSWSKLKHDPLALIMMDVDYFKKVNDSYGHQVGDQVLKWIAGLLKEEAGEEGMPIRYAGDEFMMLLVHHNRQAAMETGKRFIDRVRSEIFRPDGFDVDLRITLSIGVASAPEDAQTSKELIQKADVALYYAKKIGRNCLINAGEVDQEAVFAKTAINQLQDIKLVGRSQQLSRVTDALNKFSQHRNQFLIAQGPEGIGKSEFLDTIRRNLARINIWRVKVSGEPQEMFRPYYLMTRVLVDLLQQHPDKGAAVIESLLPMERGYIAQIIPQLGTKSILPKDLNQTTHRQFIFAAVYNFFMKLVGDRPIILFIDDLDDADEATLLLLRKLMGQTDIAIFVCGAATISSQSAGKDSGAPLDSFCANYQEELAIQKLMLTRLTDADIDTHIQAIFPNARLPENFTSTLAQISQGNPLFLSEILRKLVQDRKITLVGHQWIIEPLQSLDLPQSLEEIVTQRIAALDEESRQMLDQVSAFGEDVSLSALTGSSDKQEARVLEFVDQAVNQGLLSSQYQLNDEVIRFLGKRILSATYNAIEQERKQQLHQRIGNYQEYLYNQQLLPAASTLAYHFQRSADAKKASSYHSVQTRGNARNFNAGEAIYYTVETPADSAVAEVPLKPDDLNRIPKFLRLFTVALRNIRLYPPGSKSIENANNQLKRVLDAILRNNDTLSILRLNQAILANGQKLNVSEHKLIGDTFLQFLNRFELQGIAFHKGLRASELQIVLQAFGKTKQKMFDADHWQQFSAENRLRHIDLKQTRYAIRAKSKRVLGNPASGAVTGNILTPVADAPLPQKSLGPQELDLIPEILRGLIGTSKTVKLYNLESSAATTAINNLMGTLRRFFHWQPLLAISQISNNLLINGEKVDISGVTDFSGVVVGLLKFLDELGVENLTILKQVTVKQMKVFLNAFAEIPSGTAGSEYWKRIAETKGLSAILFDQHQYEIQVPQNLAGHPPGVLLAERQVPVSVASVTPPASQKSFDEFLAEFPALVEGLFLKGDQSGVDQAVAQLFQDFQEQQAAARKKAIDVCQGVVNGLDMAFQHDAIRSFADPLLSTLVQEKEPKIVVQAARFLSRMVAHLIRVVDYSLASRIINNFRNRYRELKAATDSQALIFARILEKGLDPPTQKLLVEDLKSDDPSKQQPAAHLLDSLGLAVMPLLIDIIKKEDNYRARHTAATLLAKLGPKAVERLKRSLFLEISPDERKRILDIIDTLSPDVMHEFIYGIGDENSQVREAAYRLAEHLDQRQAADILLDFAKSHDGTLAAGAIKCLGNLDLEGIEAVLIDLLKSSKDDQLCIACCRALGQVARPASIEPLAAVLMPKRFFFFQKKRHAQLRAAAAVALGQISDRRAAQRLAAFVDDPDPRVREIARSALNSIQV
jgi:diguanylate cyclase (GGDEF)-like protein